MFRIILQDFAVTDGFDHVIKRNPMLRHPLMGVTCHQHPVRPDLRSNRGQNRFEFAWTFGHRRKRSGYGADGQRWG